jgi:copper resistance protein C
MTTMLRWVTSGAAIGLIVVVLLPAAPASAHDRLTGSNPAANSTVTSAIDAVTLTFSVPVKQQSTTVAVTGPDAVNKANGPARSVDKNVLQAVGPLPTGVITVAWRTVSADGHAIEGRFTFTNAAAPPVAPSPSVESDQAQAVPSPTVTGPVTSIAAAADRGISPLWWLLGGLVVLAPVGAWAWWYRRRA